MRLAAVTRTRSPGRRGTLTGDSSGRPPFPPSHLRLDLGGGEDDRGAGPPGLVHRHVVATAVRGLIDAVDGAPVPVPIAGLVARPDDAHAVAYFQRLAHLSPYRRSMTLPTPLAVD